MTQIDFYQLGQAGLEAALSQLLKKTAAAGKKVLILCPKPAAVSVDDALWSHEADGWIPHGLDDGDGVEFANVWISSDMSVNRIKADFLFLLHGSEPTSWDGFSRVFCLFDGRSEAQLQQARSQWKQWKAGTDFDLGYFAQNVEGGWEKKA